MNAVIDIKSGKAEPWCALQLAAYALLDSLNVRFDEDSHVYKYFDEREVIPSVTQILQSEGFINTQWYDDWSRQKGKYVHQAIKYYLAYDLDEENLDSEIVPYLEAFKKFRADCPFDVLMSESPQFNTTYKYAGTPDLNVRFIHNRPIGIARRFALELNKEGKYKLIPYTDQNDFNVWLAAVACHHWKNNNLKGRK